LQGVGAAGEEAAERAMPTRSPVARLFGAGTVAAQSLAGITGRIFGVGGTRGHFSELDFAERKQKIIS
jgi:hypothetical protein